MFTFNFYVKINIENYSVRVKHWTRNPVLNVVLFGILRCEMKKNNNQQYITNIESIKNQTGKIGPNDVVMALILWRLYVYCEKKIELFQCKCGKCKLYVQIILSFDRNNRCLSEYWMYYFVHSIISIIKSYSTTN